MKRESLLHAATNSPELTFENIHLKDLDITQLRTRLAWLKQKQAEVRDRERRAKISVVQGGDRKVYGSPDKDSSAPSKVWNFDTSIDDPSPDADIPVVDKVLDDLIANGGQVLPDSVSLTEKRPTPSAPLVRITPQGRKVDKGVISRIKRKLGLDF